MAPMKPQGDDIRNAVKWIVEEKIHSPQKTRMKLINEACVKFNLSPADAEFLFRNIEE